jgi:uncharacterized repeat protein (TIGR01451 family)
MKKRTMVLAALLIACGLTLVSPRPVSAQIRAHVREDLATVVVRNKPVGFALGILYGGKIKSSPDSFDILCKSQGSWAYGNARGDTRRTGWVRLADLDLPNNQTPRFCGSSHAIALRKFMHRTNGVYDKNSKTCRTSSGAALTGEASCDGSETKILNDARYYRNFNFRTGRPRGAFVTLPAQEVHWRYITRRGDYVLLRLKDEDTWGFVHKDYIDPKRGFPKYENCQTRHISCCKEVGPGCPTSTSQSHMLMAPYANTWERPPFRNAFFQLPFTSTVYRGRGDETGLRRMNVGRQAVVGDDGDGGAELSLTQDASSDLVVAGSNVSYTITVFNNGASAATPFTVLANLPAETSFVSCAATGGGVCGGSGNNRSVAFDSLAADGSATITLTAAVSCSVADGTAITSTAALSCPTPGGPEGDQCSTPDEPPVDEDEDIEGNNEDAKETVLTTVSDPPPSITAPPPVTAFTGAGATVCGAFVSDAALGTATVSDNCPGVTVTRGNVPADNFFPVGQTVITYMARDRAGNAATATQLVTVIDNTPPVIGGASVDKPSVWPPDHKTVNVTVNYTATDNCGSVSSMLSIASNEPVNGLGDGDTAPDWEVLDAHHVRLRAERSGRGTGRVYTITIIATDSAGNSSSRQVFVSVPRDQRR